MPNGSLRYSFLFLSSGVGVSREKVVSSLCNMFRANGFGFKVVNTNDFSRTNLKKILKLKLDQTAIIVSSDMLSADDKHNISSIVPLSMTAFVYSSKKGKRGEQVPSGLRIDTGMKGSRRAAELIYYVFVKRPKAR